MRFSQLTVSRRVFALSLLALAALPAAGEAALIRYTFSGTVTSQSAIRTFNYPPGYGDLGHPEPISLPFGDQLGQTVQITALLNPDRLYGQGPYFGRDVSTEVPQLGGGAASIANADFGSRTSGSYYVNRYGFLALIARFADGQEFDPGICSGNCLERNERVSIYNDIHAPGKAEPSDALFISATNTPYFEYGAATISIAGTFSASALATASFGEIPVLSTGDNVTATLSSTSNE